MFVGRGRIALRATGVALLLIALVASYALIASQRNARTSPQVAARRVASSPTGGASIQLTPTRGISVTVTASPTHGAPSSSSASTSASHGASSTTTGYVVPPRYPTPVPTTSASSGSGSGGASASPTATPSVSVWRPGPTPTATPPPLDDAQVVTYSPAGPVTGNSSTISFNISATFMNTGASAWDSSYALKCVQYCGSSWMVSPRYMWPIAPGQQMLFTGTESITTGSMYSVNTTIWQMWSPASGYFGQQIKVTVIHHGWYLDFQEASPSCMGDGTQWSASGSGTASCGSSGLAMAQGGANGIGLDLRATPASYDAGTYMAKVHVHFPSASNALFAGIIITEPAATAPSRVVIMVSPAGYVCEQTNAANCLPPASPQAISPSSDYDLTVSVTGNGTLETSIYSPGGSYEGGISAGGLTGLIEVNGSGVTDAAYFTNYQFYQYK